MAIDQQIVDFMIEESVRQIKMRPFLSDFPVEVPKLKEVLLGANVGEGVVLTRLPFNTQDYKLSKKEQIITLFLRGIIQSKYVGEHYQRISKMNENEKRYFGRFSSEYEFEQMIQNEKVRRVLSDSSKVCPFSLLYRLEDHNPYISGSGHRKRRPLLVCTGASDEEIAEIMRVEKASTKKWGYSDYGK
jgi:hypothetical protein